eukprot:m.118071 g.118071  ORF g.118071 m.118071 type:complete len:593 (-) comp28631_c0_seq1:352-2130(-)
MVDRVAFAYGNTRVTKEEHASAKAIMVNDLGPPQSARNLLADIKSGKRTCEDVAREFAKRTDIANKMTNSVVRCQAIDGKDDVANPLASESIRIAKSLDQDLANSKILPLHGLPFSVKDCYLLKGTDSTVGLGQFKSIKNGVDHTATQSAALVEALIRAGAVPIAKTNIPQLMFSWECNNPVFGYTNTPSSVDFHPGGSSGGESALIGAGGSLVGVGTDIGGSCRTPAHFAGCAGIKVTGPRLGSRGKSPPFRHGCQSEIAATSGILGRTTDEIVVLLQGLLTGDALKLFRDLDPGVVPVPWNAQEFESKRKLRVGYFTFDGYMTATPPCIRAVERAKEILESQGHHVEPFPMHNLDVSTVDAINAFLAQISSNGEHVINVLDVEGEVVANFFKKLLAMVRLKSWLPSFLSTSALSWVLKNIVGAQYASELVAVSGVKSTTAYYEAGMVRAQMKEAMVNQMKKQNLDLLIGPANPLPTAPHDSTSDFTQAASYAFVYNMVDWPAGVVPVCKVNPKTDSLSDEFWKTEVFRCGDTMTLPKMRQAYEQVIASGLELPVGVQVAGLPYNEECVLRAMSIIETHGDFKDGGFTFVQ